MIRLNGQNDTIMKYLTERQQEIFTIILTSTQAQSSDIHAVMEKNGTKISLITIKRELSSMEKEGFLSTQGKGRSLFYIPTIYGRVFFDIDAHQYCSIEPKDRYGQKAFNFDLFSNIPQQLFSQDEVEQLEKYTTTYKEKVHRTSPLMQKRELERLVIELSWKSSKIEGNTYTLLDTEHLLLQQKEAPHHSKEEASMILNHKDAFYFIKEHVKEFKTLTRAHIEKVHALLTKDMHVSKGLRNGPVGITGSTYIPLDNTHQIQEAFDSLLEVVNHLQNPYAKALITLLGIGYIQPFEDGNKRTSRLMANAILMAHGCAPLSYRDTDEEAYREATLVFYELNSIIPFKRIFIEQYEFATQYYAFKP